MDQFFNQSIPAKLWHYTDLKGLKGILASGVLWATAVRSTTDSSEFVHAREFISKAIDDLPDTDKHNAYAKKFIQQKTESDFAKGLLSESYRGSFIASLSAAQDLMSQWGWYAERGRGVSLAFDLSRTRPPQGLHSTLTIAPCIYSEAKKQQYITVAIRESAAEIASLSQHVDDQAWVAEKISKFSLVRSAYSVCHTLADLKEDIDKHVRREMVIAAAQLLSDLVKLSSHCKHEAFQQENEWRVALPVRRDQVEQVVRYRGSKNQIPYIETDLFRPKLPIMEVMMGPLCSDADEVAELLSRFGYDVPRSASSIPLRIV